MKKREDLIAKMSSFRRWYHKINLGDGIVTPGLDLDNLWDNIRKARKHLEYSNKNVLDIGSWDGMWAFEAERLGANIVVATDCRYESYDNFLFCRDVLNSNVIPFFNISPYTLFERLDVYFQENWETQKHYDRLFDIVQHMGVLYHLRDPLLSLSQARSCLKEGGFMLIETAAIINESRSFMVFNNLPPNKQRIYPDITTWWAPTVPCLNEMLLATLLEPVEGTVHQIPQDKSSDGQHDIGRVSFVARAIGRNDIDADYLRELNRNYRNPGLTLINS